MIEMPLLGSHGDCGDGAKAAMGAVSQAAGIPKQAQQSAIARSILSRSYTYPMPSDISESGAETKDHHVKKPIPTPANAAQARPRTLSDTPPSTAPNSPHM